MPSPGEHYNTLELLEREVQVDDVVHETLSDAETRSDGAIHGAAVPVQDSLGTVCVLELARGGKAGLNSDVLELDEGVVVAHGLRPAHTQRTQRLVR